MTVTIIILPKIQTLYIYADWLHVAFYVQLHSSHTLLSFSSKFKKGQPAGTHRNVYYWSCNRGPYSETFICRWRKAWTFYYWFVFTGVSKLQNCSVAYSRESRSAVPQLEVCKRSTYIHKTKRKFYIGVIAGGRWSCLTMMLKLYSHSFVRLPKVSSPDPLEKVTDLFILIYSFFFFFPDMFFKNNFIVASSH